VPSLYRSLFPQRLYNLYFDLSIIVAAVDVFVQYRIPELYYLNLMSIQNGQTTYPEALKKPQAMFDVTC
jgi:hypothetical protein